MSDPFAVGKKVDCNGNQVETGHTKVFGSVLLLWADRLLISYTVVCIMDVHSEWPACEMLRPFCPRGALLFARRPIVSHTVVVRSEWSVTTDLRAIELHFEEGSSQYVVCRDASLGGRGVQYNVWSDGSNTATSDVGRFPPSRWVHFKWVYSTAFPTYSVYLVCSLMFGHTAYKVNSW